MTLIIDSHEDLAWNMVNMARDYTRAAHDTRSSERNTPIPAYNGNTLLGRPEYIQEKSQLFSGRSMSAPAGWKRAAIL